MGTDLLTATGPFRKARGVNSNDASFPSRVPTTTAPLFAVATAAGTQQVIPIGPGVSANSAVIVPYGLGASNDAFNLRVLGWREVRGEGVLTLWVPVVLCELACTVGATTGVAASAVLNTELFVDTLSLTYGNDDVSIDIVSNAADLIAHFAVAIKGFQAIELIFDQSTNSPTMNALVSLI